jgi:uncharacterized membrane protein
LVHVLPERRRRFAVDRFQRLDRTQNLDVTPRSDKLPACPLSASRQAGSLRLRLLLVHFLPERRGRFAVDRRQRLDRTQNPAVLLVSE